MHVDKRTMKESLCTIRLTGCRLYVKVEANDWKRVIQISSEMRRHLACDPGRVESFEKCLRNF